MVKTILINSTNVSNSYNNQFTYKFAGGGLELPSDKLNQIAVSQITIPYSFFNISSGIYGNSTYSILYNSVTYNITIPDSFMSVNDLNKNLQYFFVQNNLYTLDSLGGYVYYITLRYNTAQYSVEALFNNCSLASGGSNPTGMVLTGTSMQLIINNASFGKLLGLSLGTYPSSPASVTTVISSNIQVEGSPIQALTLTANIVNNAISNSPSSFYAFTPVNTAFGSNISVTAPELVWCDCYNGRYQQLVIEIRDQLSRPVQLRDNAVCFMICLKTSAQN